ncbi:MAG: hypothetical protein EON56_01080 [Alphaproteobacteria bacterium]|nr:MAG: hypothetical protein EON56_01080 [Alphaproteobacteria bacterium]
MSDKQAEVSFLVDMFNIPAAKAAAIIAEDETEVDELTAEQLKAERERDPFSEDALVPTSPEEHTVEDNGGLQKTVLRRQNETERAGP